MFHTDDSNQNTEEGEEWHSSEEAVTECTHCGCDDLEKLVACGNNDCARLDRVFCRYCSDCQESVLINLPCDHISCWDRHLPAKKNPKFKTHKQVPIENNWLVDKIFSAETDHSAQVELHKKDRLARWFIVNPATEREDDDNPAVGSYGTLTWTNRFEYLSTPADGGKPDSEQFPCLVSFIGKTGVGKSTLIRGLITLSKKAQESEAQSFETPVTRIRNLAHATKPTSAGVSLYKDPDTFTEPCPIFFADCEGFGGGVTPAGAALAASSGDDPPPSEIQITSSLYSGSADSCGEDSRSEAISNLYARFLYAFSDVVCFVSNDMQSFAAEIERLLLFIAKGFETSLNQTPSKTLIFIFNQTPDYWTEMMDPEKLKRHVLGNILNVWNNSKSLAEIKQKKWAKKISSTEEFLEKYFRKIRFCYIPRKGNAPLSKISKQYGLLRQQIVDASDFAAKERKGTWAHYSIEDLSNLFELAFKHFATQEGPFNFDLAARKHDENPVNMEDHIMCLLRHVKSGSDLGPVLDFSNLVASAFVNHCLPRGEGIPITSPETLWSKLYEEKSSGITKFSQRYQNCQFTREARKCALLSDAHGDLHRDMQGKEIGTGYFELGELENDIEYIKMEVRDRFLEQHRTVCQEDGKITHNPRPSASQVLAHRVHVLAKLRPGWKKVHSYKTCFTCLRSLPDHVLPCGHAFCETCIIDFGNHSVDAYETEMVLTKCMVCKESWELLQLIQMKPSCAGVRILTLDGGGVRGILELALWQLVEKEIGLDLPIYTFFDLIIGTNTGGIIALGSVVQNTKTAEMVDKFKKIAKEAFQHFRGTRDLKNMVATFSNHPDLNMHNIATAMEVVSYGPTLCIIAVSMGLSLFAANMIGKRSFYPSRPLQKQLQDFFGSKVSMFGSSRSTGVQRPTRVAVMATKNGGKQQVTTIANYNRRYSGGIWGDFERGDNEEDELKVWEAGLCTSATPPCFRAFQHEKTNISYLDGGLFHNNPINWALGEYQRIWVPPNDKRGSPQVMLDTLVSIGTGHCPDKKRNREGDKQDPIRASFNALWHQLDGEETWRKFKGSESYDSETHHRLNVLIKKPCALYEYDRIQSLLADWEEANNSPVASTKYAGTLLRETVKKVANLLVAKLFFFQPIQVVSGGEHRASPKIEGSILCRLKKNEAALKLLVERINNFVVVERENAQDGRIVKVGTDIRNAVRGGYGFKTSLTIEPTDQSSWIKIFVVMKPTEGSKSPPVLISGFPRKFEDLRALRDLQQARYRHS